MPPHPHRRSRPAMFNTPAIRNGGFGALQVEAVLNRPVSIARRHLAASQLRMRDIEPEELSSSEWVQFLVMEEHARDRWITDFARRRRRGESSSSASPPSSSSSSSSSSSNINNSSGGSTPISSERSIPPVSTTPSAAAAKEEEAHGSLSSSDDDDTHHLRRRSMPLTSSRRLVGVTPPVSLWARALDVEDIPTAAILGSMYTERRPRHVRHAATESLIIRGRDELPPPPTYEIATRSRTPPPAYEPR